MRFFIATLVIVSILALAATLGTIVVGILSFEGLVVENPYETGLKWDEIQKQKAGAKGADTAAAGTRPDCDIQHGPCIRQTADGLSVSFDILPKPVAALSELTFSLTLTRRGKPVTDASSVILDLSMPGMFMGKNRPALKKLGNGRYEGTGIITKCMSGKKTWRAEVTVAHDGKTSVADFVFDVK